MRRVLLGAVIAGSVALFGIFLAGQVPESLQGLPDFPNYYIGGERLFAGEPVYGPIDREVEDRFGVSGYDAYPADPPPTVALVAPLSLLPYEPAWILLAAVSVAIVITVVYATARRLGYPSDVSAAASTAALLTTSVRFLITRNHIESIVLLAGFLGWWSLRRSRDGAAGAWWGVATSLKLFPGMWLVGLTRRGRRGLAAGILSLAVIGGLSLLVVGWANARDFATEVVGASTGWYGALGNYSLLSFGTALVGTWFGWLLLAIGATVLVPLYLRRGSETPDQVWVGGTAAALLLSPLSWLNYLVLAIPALLIVAARIDLRRAADRWLLLGLVASLGFWGPVVLATEVPSVLASFVPTYGLIALFTVSVRRLGVLRESPVTG